MRTPALAGELGYAPPGGGWQGAAGPRALLVGPPAFPHLTIRFGSPLSTGSKTPKQLTGFPWSKSVDLPHSGRRPADSCDQAHQEHFGHAQRSPLVDASGSLLQRVRSVSPHAGTADTKTIGGRLRIGELRSPTSWRYIRFGMHFATSHFSVPVVRYSYHSHGRRSQCMRISGANSSRSL